MQATASTAWADKFCRSSSSLGHLRYDVFEIDHLLQSHWRIFMVWIHSSGRG